MALDLATTILESLVWGVRKYDPIPNLNAKCFRPYCEMNFITYRVSQGGILYDIGMPRSRTFDAYLKFAHEPDDQIIEYNLTPIETLHTSVIALISNTAITDKHAYVLDFLDLHSCVHTEHLKLNPDMSVSVSEVEMDMTQIGSTLHGLTVIKSTESNGNRHIHRHIQLYFRYGRLHNNGPYSGIELETPQCRSFSTSARYDYENGRLKVSRAHTWSYIFRTYRNVRTDTLFYTGVYAMIYDRLIVDRVFDGRSPSDRGVIAHKSVWNPNVYVIHFHDFKNPRKWRLDAPKSPFLAPPLDPQKCITLYVDTDSQSVIARVEDLPRSA